MTANVCMIIQYHLALYSKMLSNVVLWKCCRVCFKLSILKWLLHFPTHVLTITTMPDFIGMYVLQTTTSGDIYTHIYVNPIFKMDGREVHGHRSHYGWSWDRKARFKFRFRILWPCFVTLRTFFTSQGLFIFTYKIWKTVHCLATTRVIIFIKVYERVLLFINDHTDARDYNDIL